METKRLKKKSCNKFVNNSTKSKMSYCKIRKSKLARAPSIRKFDNEARSPHESIGVVKFTNEEFNVDRFNSEADEPVKPSRNQTFAMSSNSNDCLRDSPQPTSNEIAKLSNNYVKKNSLTNINKCQQSPNLSGSSMEKLAPRKRSSVLPYSMNWGIIVILTIVLILSGDYAPQQLAPKTVEPTYLGAFSTALLELISSSRVRILKANAQYKPLWPSKSLEQEIFLLNLEDGYFGCQVNESQDFLQLFELSKLCDGQTQCFLGTDEMTTALKCNKRDRCGVGGSGALTAGGNLISSAQSSLLTALAPASSSSNGNTQLQKQQEGYQCVNGVCLDGLCYCNDGWGGKSCDVPDENECKFRPCDVFAHCTNTMGSYYCSCFPGYDGDGMHCQDINECEIPSLAALCSDNSECCNLPGHFVCKCKPGYQQSGQSQSLQTGAPSGNTSVSCTDIDECLDERACGRGAHCENLPGSFRCSCPAGFTGNPQLECIDMDECRNEPCGIGAQCTNIPGGYKCSCAPGFEKNPALPSSLFGTIHSAQQQQVHQEQSQLAGDNSTFVACLDVNECQKVGGANLCGLNAQCVNTAGAYFCQCPPNYTGNPKVSCQDIDECQNHGCGPNALCKNLPGFFKCECKQGYSGNAYSAEGCQDEDECSRKDTCGANAQCFNSLGSFQCSCLSGFSGDPYQKCLDIDECAANPPPCGSNAQCFNTEGGFKCSCPDKYMARGTPEMGCERAAVDIGCSNNFDCTQNALCLNSTCQCKLGYQINGIDCVDVDECLISSPQQQQQLPIKPFTKISAALAMNNINNSSSLCGSEAQCFNLDGSYRCECQNGYEKIDPQSPQSKCRDVDECSLQQQVCGQNSKCFNTEGSFKCNCNDGFILIDQEQPSLGCKSPCDGVNCGPHATCKPHGQEAACVCKSGFTFDPNNIKLGCVDINECDTNYGPSGLCGQRALCTNIPGSYKCSCPSGFTGDAYRYCEDINECDRRFGVFGQCGELAICNNTQGSYNCQCAPGYMGDPRVKCQDIDECQQKNKCGLNAQCTNLPGKYQCKCPQGYSGDPYEKCQLELPTCQTNADCGANFVCQLGRCQCPFTHNNQLDSLECKHPCDKTECGAHATCQLDNDNQALCMCDSGYMSPSDGRSGCTDINECIQGTTLTGMTSIQNAKLAGSIALGPVTMSPLSSSTLASANGSHPCGRNALCRNLPGSFDCVCPPGYSGDAYQACLLDVRNQQQQLLQQNQTSQQQQEPRTSTCSEPCQRGHVCSDGQCIKSDSCRENQDCKSSQVCEHVNRLVGFQCVDVCELNAVPCGPEAKCTPVNHKPVCACNQGFAGDPYDRLIGCQPYDRDVSGKQQTPTTLGPGGNGFSLTTKSDSDMHRSTQEGDISTVSLPDYTQTLINNTLEQQLQRQQQQQNFEVHQHQNKKQQQAGYELPLPTTPLLPLNGAPYGQTQSPFGLLQQQQNHSLSEQSKQTTLTPASISTKSTVSSTSTTTTTANNSKQTTSSLLNNRKPTNQQQQQQQQTNQMISLNRQDQSDNQQLVDQHQVLSNQQQREDPVMQTFNQFNNKSSIQQQQVFHKHLSCTSDQHCPGNLFCLTNLAEFGKSNQRVCGCPSGYKREGDYCYMQRVNCTSASLCKPREECMSNQQQLGSQQFESIEVSTFTGICICPRGYKLTANGVACIDRNECDEGTPCALGAICQNKIGSYECVCPPGTTGEPYTKTCEPINSNNKLQLNECSSNSDCSNDKECDSIARKCVSPCHMCGPRAVCTAANHVAICLCPPRYTGNAIDLVYGCQEPIMTTTPTSPKTSATSTSTTTSRPSLRASPSPSSTAVGVPVTTLLPSQSSSTTVAPFESTTPELVEFRTIPPSELFVMCLADGIQVEVQLGGFDGIIYVKGHSQDPKCRKLVMSNNANEFVDFKVQFGNCDLIHRDGEAGFVLVIQKHPKLVTYRARAYHVKCVYNTGERTVTLGFNVSMITTSGTIANTGPPPTCLMSITALNGHEVTSAEIGQDLLLRVDVQPDSIYGGFARSCEAKTMDDEGEYQYEVTDANGCATDPSIFSDWKYDQDRKSLVARFNAFKFPSSNNLRFQCNIRVCFGSCPAVNCNGIDAYGKRRRRRRRSAVIGTDSIDGFNATSSTTDDDNDPTTVDELIVTDAFKEGALREEIMVQSNAILTFDKKESLPQQQQRNSLSAPVEDIEFVCLPRLGIFMSIVLTTLIALLALAIATSCWCFNKRKLANRRQQGQGPLPHPINFPNPLLRSSSSSISTLREPIYGP